MQWGGSQAIIVIEGENNREKYERACPIYKWEGEGLVHSWLYGSGIKGKIFGWEKMYFQNLLKFSAVFDYWQRIVVRNGFI